MLTGRPKAPLMLSDEQRQELLSWSRSRSIPQALAKRARIILLSANGLTNTAIAKKIGMSNWMVGLWRQRFIERGMEGLYDEYRPGRPRTHSEEAVAKLIRTTLKKKPNNATHWSVRSAAEATNFSKSTVQRIWNAFGIQPHRQHTFKLSNDPFFVEKVIDIVGLYLNPPDKAMVLCVDEKSQIQALERSQPMLPLGLGYVEGITHDYYRHGTLTLYAALDIHSGKVLTQCKKRHRHQEFLQFLRHLEKHIPSDLDVHLIIDNYATHKHAKVKAWLAQRPRFHAHFTPTYSSWLNQVEIWFNIITQKAIRRGTFKSVKELRAKIDRFVANYNKQSKPFIWTATAESIFEKLKRLLQRISGTVH